MLTFSEAKCHLKKLDLGSKRLWKTAPAPGDSRTVVRMRCAFHVDCNFWVEAKFCTKTGMFIFESSGKHSEVVVEKCRKNGILSPQQELDLRVALRAGTAPAHLRSAMTLQQEEELMAEGKDPNDHKRKEGGLAGDEKGGGAMGSWECAGMCSAREEYTHIVMSVCAYSIHIASCPPPLLRKIRTRCYIPCVF